MKPSSQLSRIEKYQRQRRLAEVVYKIETLADPTKFYLPTELHRLAGYIDSKRPPTFIWHNLPKLLKKVGWRIFKSDGRHYYTKKRMRNTFYPRSIRCRNPL